ncbi:MAG: ABC transporter permease [Planctomycetota bacterium]|jgi:ABC-type lipoprotein release transport system permease subunit
MYKLILAFRYLVRRRISYLAFVAVALCVFIVVVVMTVMRGLVTDFRQKNHSFVGDCVVGTESLVGFAYYQDFVDALEQAEFVEAVSAVIKGYALVSPNGSDTDLGLELIGIDPVRHSRATGFGRTLYHRAHDVSKAFEPMYHPNSLGCVLGIDRVLPRNSDGKYSYEAGPVRRALSVSCFPLTARGVLAKPDLDVVNTKTFYYSDHSHSGLAHEDYMLIYLPFEWAQSLCGMAGPEKRASAIHIKFKTNVGHENGRDKVAELWGKFKHDKADRNHANLLENVTVQSWKQYRRAFIAGMEKEQTMLTVMFAMVGLTTVFIVFVVFYMIVSHKSKDIGILKSIGVARLDLVKLFLGFGFLVGICGSLVGLFGGWLFLLKINRIEDWLFQRFGFQLWDRTLYAIGDIPSRVDAATLAVIVLSAIMACLAGALVPSWQAAKAEPVDTLQVSGL